MNKNATFKEVFKPIEAAHFEASLNLPEKSIAEKIYKLRMINGYTQKEFAKICSIGYSSICKYELGFKPSDKNIEKICSALNISINYFS